MKSGVQPWILCGFHSWPARSAAPSGSTTAIFTFGRAGVSMSLTPVRVPPVP